MDAYFESLLHVEHKVLGCKLQPFTLAHLECLFALGHPIVRGKLHSEADLCVAVAICRSKNPFQEATNMSLPFWVKWKRYNFTEERAKFNSYIADFVALPEYWKEKESEEMMAGHSCRKKAKCPLILKVICRLMNNGMTQDEAWNTPVGIAFWMVSAIAENDGAEVDLITDEDKEIERLLNERN